MTAKGGNATVSIGEDGTYGNVYGISSGITAKYGMKVTDGASVTAIAGNSVGQNSMSRGIYVESEAEDGDGGLVIEGAVVEAIAGTASCKDQMISAQSVGVSVIGKIEVDFDGYLEAEGKKAEGKYGTSFGIQGYKCAVAIYDGYLKATGAEVEGTVYAGSYGAYLAQECFAVYDEKSVVELVAGHAKATEKAYSNGLFTDEGDVVVNAGNVKITSGSWEASGGNGYGIYAIAGEQEDGSYLGGTVSISCDDVHLSSGTFAFVGTKVNVISESDSAIYAQINIEIDDDLEANGTVSGRGEFDETTYSHEYYSFVDSDEKELQKVTVKPIIYKVTLDGMKMSIQVPAGKTPNETYCESFGVEDLSESINTKKEGFEFAGWYLDKEFTEDNKFTFDMAVYEDITLYGKWTEVVEDSGNLDNKDDEPKDEIVSKEDEPKDEIVSKDDEIKDEIVSKDDETKDEIVSKDDDSKEEVVNQEDNSKEDAVSNVPQTGDNNMFLFWITLLSMSTIVMAVLRIKKVNK